MMMSSLRAAKANVGSVALCEVLCDMRFLSREFEGEGDVARLEVTVMVVFQLLLGRTQTPREWKLPPGEIICLDRSVDHLSTLLPKSWMTYPIRLS
jgi:hypothetical protein